MFFFRKGMPSKKPDRSCEVQIGILISPSITFATNVQDDSRGENRVKNGVWPKRFVVSDTSRHEVDVGFQPSSSSQIKYIVLNIGVVLV